MYNVIELLVIAGMFGGYFFYIGYMSGKFHGQKKVLLGKSSIALSVHPDGTQKWTNVSHDITVENQVGKVIRTKNEIDKMY